MRYSVYAATLRCMLCDSEVHSKKTFDTELLEYMKLWSAMAVCVGRPLRFIVIDQMVVYGAMVL